MAKKSPVKPLKRGDKGYVAPKNPFNAAGGLNAYGKKLQASGELEAYVKKYEASGEMPNGTKMLKNAGIATSANNAKQAAKGPSASEKAAARKEVTAGKLQAQKDKAQLVKDRNANPAGNKAAMDKKVAANDARIATENQAKAKAQAESKAKQEAALAAGGKRQLAEAEERRLQSPALLRKAAADKAARQKAATAAKEQQKAGMLTTAKNMPGRGTLTPARLPGLQTTTGGPSGSPVIGKGMGTPDWVTEGNGPPGGPSKVPTTPPVAPPVAPPVVPDVPAPRDPGKLTEIPGTTVAAPDPIKGGTTKGTAVDGNTTGSTVTGSTNAAPTPEAPGGMLTAAANTQARPASTPVSNNNQARIDSQGPQTPTPGGAPESIMNVPAGATSAAPSMTRTNSDSPGWESLPGSTTPTGGAAPTANPNTGITNPAAGLPDVDTSIDASGAPGAVGAPTVGADVVQADTVSANTTEADVVGATATGADVTQITAPEDITKATIADYTARTAQTNDITAKREDGTTMGDNSLVENRMSKLLSQGSDYMDRAESRANRISNRRGMLNSAMAVGSAHGAAIDAALPIAQQDARTFATQDLANQTERGAANQAQHEASVSRNNLNAGMDQDTRVYNQTNNLDTLTTNAAAENTAAGDLAAATNTADNNYVAAQNAASGDFAAAQNTADNNSVAAQNASNTAFAGDQNTANTNFANAVNTASNNFAAERNKNNFEELHSMMTAQLAGIDNQLAMNLQSLTSQYGIMENLDSIQGSIYQEMIDEMGTILASTPDPGEASARVNALMQSAGVEFEFVDGGMDVTGLGQVDVPPPGATTNTPPPVREPHWGGAN